MPCGVANPADQDLRDLKGMSRYSIYSQTAGILFCTTIYRMQLF